jgi:hypothetical protein
MGAKLRLKNQSSHEVLIQVELTGLTKIAPPSSQVVIDTDFEQGEELQIVFSEGHLTVWGGVAAIFVEEERE